MPFTPAELFHHALRGIRSDLAKQGNKAFNKLTPQEQDAYLKQLETGGKDLNGVTSKVFFESLLELMIEGYFSDPVYGGNKDMGAWKMIGFPGAYATYYHLVDQHGMQFNRAPMSLGSDFVSDNFDHGPLGFVGGAYVGEVMSHGRPIEFHPTPRGTPKWGVEWKKAVARHYNHTCSLNIHGSSVATRQNYLDLDPTYKDAWGNPLLRMTFDFPENDLKMAVYITEKTMEIGKAMGGQIVEGAPRKGPYTITQYQTTHNIGGTVMGTDPSTMLPAKLERAQRIRHRRIQLSAERVVQPDRYRPRACLLGGRRHHEAVPEESRTAGAGIMKTAPFVFAGSLAACYGAHAQQGSAQVPPEVATCVACHGQKGEGNAASNFPRLASQPQAYLVK